MKKSILIIMLFLISAISINATAEEDPIKIVCTNSILSDFTSNILTEDVSIDYIMPAGVCPAYYDTKPSDVDKILDAEIIISFGSPMMEPWLKDLLDYNDNYSLIECKDMGEWNIPTGAVSYVEYISEKIEELLPNQKATIQANTQDYINQINTKADELKNQIELKNLASRKIISMAWQKDFLEYMGLDVTFTYGPPQGLSAQDQLDVIQAAEDAELSVIIDNLQSGTDFGARVASETGASHIIFTNFPGAIPGTDTYLDMIEYNTEQLINGIETYDSNQGEIKGLQNQVKNLEAQRNSFVVIGLILGILSIIFYMFYKKK